MEEARTHELSPATVTAEADSSLVPSRPASLGPVRVACRGRGCVFTSQRLRYRQPNSRSTTLTKPNWWGQRRWVGTVLLCPCWNRNWNGCVCGGQRPGLAPTTWIDPPTPGRCRGRCFITPNCLLVLLRVRIHGLIKLTMADPRRCINCRCASDRAASANTTAGTILVYSRCY